jgi:predicted nucleotidyltransferase
LEDVLGAKVDVLSLRAAKKTFLERIQKDLVNVS